LSLRKDKRILKLPPYLSLVCIIVGVTWLFLLPLDDNSRRTYISENALLPGQVHTYFGGSDQNVFRAYKHEVNTLLDRDNFEYVVVRPSLSVAMPKLTDGPTCPRSC
jgi:glycosylphosphatidylinositol transamidase